MISIQQKSVTLPQPFIFRGVTLFGSAQDVIVMTPKDVVRLATKLVLAPDEAVFSEKGVIRTVYDPACGLLGFISDAIDQINQMGSTATIVPFGQELDPKTHAMALTAMLIRGYKSENIAQGSTLSNDLHRDKRFHYGLANPPFGIKWEKDKPAVEKEHKELGYAGRFGPGLPRVSDGSMLFLMHLVSKMERPENGGGRVGIVLSGSPLFTGDAGSGESEIRRWLLEQDLVEAIVALPTDMFFNTGIGTYVWILSNHKEKRRKGKVQLINLSDTWSAMRKSEGTKRRFLSDDQIDDIVREYADFTETERSKIFKTTDFAYRKVAIKRPLKAKLVITKAKIKTLFDQKAFEKLDEAQQTAWIDYFRELISQPNGGQQEYTWAFEIVKAKNKEEGFGKTTKALANAFIAAFMERDEDAEPVLDDNGRVIPDTSLNDTESVPFGTLVEDYFKAEVLPHVADAFIDYSVRDSKDGEVGIVGYEINFNRYFYRYVEPRNQGEIEVDLSSHESKIRTLLDELEKRQKRITSAIFSGLKNDSGFKDSGVSWIGSIPESWDVKPMFSYVTESKISNKGMVEDNLLSLSYGKIKRKNIDTLGGLLPESYETYQIVNKGDVVFRLTDLQNDKRSLRSALCMERGIITSAYIAVTPKGIRPKYFNFLMRAYDEVKVFYNLGSGMRQSLKYSELKRLPILCPPDSVQRDIEEFIDKEINDIESIVEELNYFIDLLKEYRSSIVHCAALGMLKA